MYSVDDCMYVVNLYGLTLAVSVVCLSGCVVMSTATRVHDGELQGFGDWSWWSGL